jgi:Uma2 family endonuclease
MSQRLGDQPKTRRKRTKKPLMLAVPSGVRLRISPASFWRLCLVNHHLRLERSAKGELIIMPPAGPDGCQRNMSLGAQLWNWNHQTDLGIVFDSSAGFTLPNSAIVGPDVTWMTRERWEALPQAEREIFSHICPDFVAEVRSRSDRMPKLRDKMREYIAQGVRLAWMIDPRTETVEIYRPGRPVEVLKRPATLSGEDVLPGFVLDLKGILFD